MQSTTLHVTQDVELLSECDFMLVYLTAQTWTLAVCLARRWGRVIDADVSLLLAHEMIGVGGQANRFGCEFSSFFSCDDA